MGGLLSLTLAAATTRVCDASASGADAPAPQHARPAAQVTPGLLAGWRSRRPPTSSPPAWRFACTAVRAPFPPEPKLLVLVTPCPHWIFVPRHHHASSEHWGAPIHATLSSVVGPREGRWVLSILKPHRGFSCTMPSLSPGEQSLSCNTRPRCLRSDGVGASVALRARLLLAATQAAGGAAMASTAIHAHAASSMHGAPSASAAATTADPAAAAGDVLLLLLLPPRYHNSSHHHHHTRYSHRQASHHSLAQARGASFHWLP